MAALSPSRLCHRCARITGAAGAGFLPAVYANFAAGIIRGLFRPGQKMSPDPGARRSGLKTKARGAGLNRSLTETRAGPSYAGTVTGVEPVRSPQARALVPAGASAPGHGSGGARASVLTTILYVQNGCGKWSRTRGCVSPSCSTRPSMRTTRRMTATTRRSLRHRPPPSAC